MDQNRAFEVWDQAAIEILKGAQKEACRRAEAIAASNEAIRDVIARHIIVMAKRGVLDHHRLVEGALNRLRRERYRSTVDLAATTSPHLQQ